MSFLSRSLFLVVLSHSVAFAQSVPPLMNYQGQLSDATGQAVNGQRSLIFRVYDVPTGGTAIWGPQTITADVANGYFNVVLSNDTTGGDSITTAFAGHPRYVSVSVNPVGQSGAAEILPRQQVLSTPYAMSAATADHGSLTGRGDDDHPQYLLRAEIDLAAIQSLSGLTANAGVYDNRIAQISPSSAYSEVCFKAGAIQSDPHPSGGSTAGGNCAPGDVGWIIEKNERAAAMWAGAKATCLLQGMRLPEPFEFSYSCSNASTLGLTGIADNLEWSGNEAVPQGDGSYSGVAVPILGGGNCGHGLASWVGNISSAPSGPYPFRCAR